MSSSLRRLSTGTGAPEICKAEPTHINSEYLTSKWDNKEASYTILSNMVTYNSYTHFATNKVALGGHAKEKISAVCSY
jgi:hypothetical protein